MPFGLSVSHFDLEPKHEQSGGIDLPIDFEHQNDNPDASLKSPVPAAGWIKVLRGDAGLRGRVTRTAPAAEMIGNREYRSTSPGFMFDPETRRIVKLKGAGLVHNPNPHLTALAGEQPPMARGAPDADMMQRILAAPGLPPDTSPDQIADAFARIGALRELVTGKPTAAAASPDPARYVPVSAVAEMLRRHSEEQAARTEDRVLAKVNGACRDGCPGGGMRDQARALCRSDEAAFDTVIARSLPPYAHLLKPSAHNNAIPVRGAATPDSDAAAAVCAQFGLKPDALNTCSFVAHGWSSARRDAGTLPPPGQDRALPAFSIGQAGRRGRNRRRGRSGWPVRR